MLSAKPVNAQERTYRLEIETEPVAYILSGAGGTVAYHRNYWTYSIEVFRADIPQSLHGHEKFGTSTVGAELQAERFFGESSDGFFAGPEIGIGRLDVTHHASGKQESHVRYSVGVRGGYQWYTGLGNLYLSPVVGLVYTLNAEAIEIEGDTFESGPLTPFGTVGIGWSF